MKTFFAVAVLAALPGLVAWWDGRRLLARRDDPALAERFLKLRWRSGLLVFFVLLGILLALAVTRDLAYLGLLVVLWLGFHFGSFPLRRDLFEETWSVLGCLAFHLRLYFALTAFWTVVWLTPYFLYLAGEGRWIAAAVAAAVLLVWERFFARVTIWALGARPLDDALRARLAPHLEPVQERARAAAPEILVFPTFGGRFVNAFAFPGVRAPRVFFSESLLQLLEGEEVGGIFAHEVAHLEHFDARELRRLGALTYTLIAAAFALPLTWLGASPAAAVPGWAAGTVWVVLALFLSVARQRWMQRHEKETDQRAVELLGDPETLIRALVRLHQLALVPRRLDRNLESSMSHPSLASRVRAIREAAGLAPAPAPTGTLVVRSPDGKTAAILESDRIDWLEGLDDEATGDGAELREAASSVLSRSYDRLAELRLDVGRGDKKRLVAVDTQGQERTLDVAAEDVAGLQSRLDAVDVHLVPVADGPEPSLGPAGGLFLAWSAIAVYYYGRMYIEGHWASWLLVLWAGAAGGLVAAFLEAARRRRGSANPERSVVPVLRRMALGSPAMFTYLLLALLAVALERPLLVAPVAVASLVHLTFIGWVAQWRYGQERYELALASARVEAPWVTWACCGLLPLVSELVVQVCAPWIFLLGSLVGLPVLYLSFKPILSLERTKKRRRQRFFELRCLLKLERHGEAQEILDELLKPPPIPQAVLRARLKRDMRRFVETHQVLLIHVARAYLDAGVPATAATVLETLDGEKLPPRVELRRTVFLAVALARLERPGEAVERLRAIVGHKKLRGADRALVLAYLARFELEADGDPQAALEWARQAWRRWRSRRVTRPVLAAALVRAGGSPEEALGHLRAASRRLPREDTPAREARRDLSRPPALPPPGSKPWIFYHLGVCYEALGREPVGTKGREMQPGRDRQLLTVGLLLGIVLSAVELTAVSAAMPTAVAELGGVERYSWVFTAYLLTSTTTMPLYGKLADLYGRRRIYQLGATLFLLGSTLCGTSGSFPVLICFRAVQGLGAGALMPLTATVIGDIYTLRERGRVQGVLAGTWAVASLLGPLAGGWITDLFSWRWIFYLSVPAGLLAIWLVGRHLREEVEPRRHAFDVLGTVSLTAAVTTLLLALSEGATSWGLRDPRTLGMLAAAAAGLGVFLWQERRAPEPMLPLDLFRNRLIAVASAGNLLIGMLLFSLVTYVPVFGQGVLGGTAVDAGALLIPVSLGWTLSITAGGRLLLRLAYRTFLLWGVGIAVTGAALLASAGAGSARLEVMTATFLVGLGLGWMSMPCLIGVQNAVPWQRRGVATGSVQFFRSIGGALAVAMLGALFHARQATVAGGLDVDAALDPRLRAELAPATLDLLQGALLHGLRGVFAAILGIAALAFAVALLFPPGGAEELAWRED